MNADKSILTVSEKNVLLNYFPLLQEIKSAPPHSKLNQFSLTTPTYRLFYQEFVEHFSLLYIVHCPIVKSRTKYSTMYVFLDIYKYTKRGEQILLHY